MKKAMRIHGNGNALDTAIGSYADGHGHAVLGAMPSAIDGHELLDREREPNLHMNKELDKIRATYPKMAKNARRPRGRYGRGLPKKGGAGGKGTWGKPGSELVGVEVGTLADVDPHDPNYDSDSLDGNVKFESITPPLNEDEVERHVAPIISEYFEHGSTVEVMCSLDEMNLGDNEYQIIVIAITLAMERKNGIRELTSVLLSDLYGRYLSEPDMERGFELLLKSLPELILDTPTAPDILGSFLARAVADDCIPPKFVNVYKAAADSDMPDNLRNCIEHASALLNMKQGMVRLDSVWGVTGGMRPVKYLVRQIQLLLREYLASGIRDEAERCLQELEVPHFHHEMVYEAVMMAIEDGQERTMDLIIALLKALDSSAVVTRDQQKAGFLRVVEDMPEIRIDVPRAYELLDKFAMLCERAGVLIPREVKELSASRARKRFVSEGDGGLIKEID